MSTPPSTDIAPPPASGAGHRRRRGVVLLRARFAPGFSAAARARTRSSRSLSHFARATFHSGEPTTSIPRGGAGRLAGAAWRGSGVNCDDRCPSARAVAAIDPRPLSPATLCVVAATSEPASATLDLGLWALDPAASALNSPDFSRAETRGHERLAVHLAAVLKPFQPIICDDPLQDLRIAAIEQRVASEFSDFSAGVRRR